MNRTIRFSLKTAMKHIMTVRNMFADGDTYFTKLNSNLTPNSRQVRRTILAYMLQDGVIFKLGDTKATWNTAADQEFLVEWTRYVYETHNKPKKTSGKVKPVIRGKPTITFGTDMGVTEGQPLFKVEAVASVGQHILQIAPWGIVKSPSVSDPCVGGVSADGLREPSNPHPRETSAAVLADTAKAVEASDKNGQHSIKATCAILNNKTALKGRPATSIIHDEVDDLVFLTSKEAVDIVKAMNSLVRDYTALIHSGKDPLILRETVAGRLANMALRPLRNQGVQG